MKLLEFKCTGAESLGYNVILPDDFKKEDKLPMIVFLHGAGERGDGKSELSKAAAVALPKHVMNGNVKSNCVLLCPQCPNGMVWNQIVFKVMELVKQVAEDFCVAKNKISLTGLSMGGFGTWELGMTYPEYFSALAPICGGGMAWRTGALKGKPIWAVHGSADESVNISNSYDMVARARKAGADVRFTICEGVGHNCWDFAYCDTRLVDWLLEKSL